MPKRKNLNKKFNLKRNPDLLIKEKWYYARRKCKPTDLHPYNTIRLIFKLITYSGSNIIVYTQEPGTVIKTQNKVQNAYHIEEVKLSDLSDIKGPFNTYNDTMDAIYDEVYG